MAFRSRRCSSQTFLFALFIMIVLKGKGSAQGLRIVGPGSRASSLGEAFTALADDASAIYWNPAGLTGAQRREISLSCEESYSWKTMRLRMASWGNERRPDIESRASRNTLGFGLVGVVIPFGKGWVGGFGVYHPVNSETRWSGTDLSPLTANRPDIQWSGRVGITSISTALAYRIDEHFAIGASLILNAGRFGFNRYGGNFLAPFPDPPYFQEIDLGQYAESTTGWGVGATLGLLFRPSDRFSIGVVFRTPSKIRFRGEASMEGFPVLSMTLRRNIENACAIRKDIEWPMNASAGITGKPIKALMITADLEWTRWSSLPAIQTVYQNADWTSYMSERDNDQMPMFVRDALQFKLGAEVSFRTWAIRVGFNTDPSPAPNSVVNSLFPNRAAFFVSTGASVKLPPFRVDAFMRYRIPAMLSQELTEMPSAPPSTRTIWDFRLLGLYEEKSLALGLTVSRAF